MNLKYDWLDDLDLSSTTPFETENIFFLVTPGETYTNFEKMILPFDSETWKYLLITFGSAFSIIFVINQLSKKVKDLLYGNDVQTPAFNIVSIFFGIGQVDTFLY
jgi:hypothetical protein